MPRKPRIWDPGSIYHIDARAHGGAPIFSSDEDRAFVRDRAAKVFEETGVVCVAWSILDNHYHVLVRSAGPPGRAILRLNTAIARRVRSRGGAGAVFQGRYFSGICADESSFLVRLAYVTANPVHHRIVPTVSALCDHPWSSLGEVLGVRKARLVDPGAVHSLLDPDANAGRARVRLLDLCEMRARLWAERTGDATADEPPEPTVAIRRRIGEEIRSPRTLRSVSGPPSATAYDWETRAARRAVLQAEGWTPERLVPVACALTGGDPGAVRRGRKTRPETRARALVAYVACDHLGWEHTRVAAAVGATVMPVYRARERGATLLEGAGLTAEEFVRRSR